MLAWGRERERGKESASQNALFTYGWAIPTGACRDHHCSKRRGSAGLVEFGVVGLLPGWTFPFSCICSNREQPSPSLNSSPREVIVYSFNTTPRFPRTWARDTPPTPHTNLTPLSQDMGARYDSLSLGAKTTCLPCLVGRGRGQSRAKRREETSNEKTKNRRDSPRQLG